MSSTSDIIALAVGGGLGATVVRSIADTWKGRQRNRQRAEEEPERRVATSLAGAQQAVVVMDQALKAATERAETAEQTVRDLRQEIHALEQTIADMRRQLDAAAASLASLHDRLPET